MDALELTDRAAEIGRSGADGTESLGTLPEVSELRSHFENRGPIVAGFGLYLSSRLDLVSAAEAAALAMLDAPVAPLAHRHRDELLAGAFGRGPTGLLAELESRPLDVNHLFQWHRARLADGERVIIKLVRTDFEALLERDLERLLTLARGSGRDRSTQLLAAVDDFESTLRQALDLEKEAEDLVRVRESSEDLRMVTAPRVYRDLGNRQVLVYEDLTASAPPPGDMAASPEAGDRAIRTARRLCRGWLRLALSTGLLPVEPAGRSVILLADGGVAFAGGPFRPTSKHEREELRGYLAAVAVGDSRRVTSALLQLTRERNAADERRLWHRIRHAEPFRDGGWPPTVDALGRTVFAHWRLTAATGFAPNRVFLAFLRGLSLVTREAGRIAPGEDPLREAFQEVRLGDVLGELARMADPGELEDLFRRQASLVTDLPRKLDHMLTEAIEEPREREDAGSPPARRAWTLLAALLLAMAGIVIAVGVVGGALAESGWVERLGALAFVLLGGLAVGSALAGR